MFGNEKGSSTVESVIILPLIMLLVFGLLLLLLNTYDFSKQVLKYHEQILLDESPDAIQMTYKVYKYDIPVTYDYQKFTFESSLLQQVIEYIIYLMETYDEVLKGILYDNEQ